jgi:hypothetical protein
MPLVYTSDDLLEAVKNSGMIPEAQSTGCTDPDILDHLSAVLQSTIALELLKIREEYYVTTERIAAATEVRIPHRAMGGKIRDLAYVEGSDRQYLNAIPREDLPDYDSPQGVEGYYLEGNYIKLVPPATVSGYLEIAYFMRPNDLVENTDARQVTVVSGQTVTLASAIPDTWTTANTFDIHSQYSGAELKVWDATASVVGAVPLTNQITFTTAISGTTYGTHAVAVGDWVCLAGESVVPALPRELHPVLVRGACLRLAEAFGDSQALQYHGVLFQSDLTRALKVFEGRVEGKPLRISGSNSVLWG